MNTKYRNSNKHIGTVALILASCLFTAGCGSAAKWEYKPITDINNLEGRRVACNLSWESDYYLSGREDMQLYRYDATADMIMALKYDKIDAIALDMDTLKIFLAKSKGLEVVQPPFAYVSSIAYIGSDDGALRDDFNKFLAEYKKTDEYQEFLKRLDDFDGRNYNGPDVPNTGTGETLNLVVEPENFPRAFMETGHENPIGYDIELVQRYANDRNRKLVIHIATYENGILGLQTGRYDMMVGYISDVYAEGIKQAGLNISDSMFEYPLYFLQKNQEEIESYTDDLD